MIAVINASPLIYLGKIGALDILPQLFDEIWTCQEVKDEVLREETAPEIPVLKKAFYSWLQIHQPKNEPLINRLLELQLHRGEAVVIAIANELSKLRKEPVAIIDDLAARDVARTLEIPVIGTVGVLLKGVKMAIIETEHFKNQIKKLIEETDFRMSIQIYLKLMEELETIKK